jgi:hypothetical protein
MDDATTIDGAVVDQSKEIVYDKVVIAPVGFSVNDQICFNRSVPMEPEVMPITVHVADLMPTTSLLMSSALLFENWLRMMGKNAAEYRTHLTLNTMYASSLLSENVPTSITVQCWYWVTERVNNEDYKHWSELPSQPSGLKEDIAAELSHLVRSCLEFLKARFNHLNHLVSLREVSIAREQQQQTDNPNEIASASEQLNLLSSNSSMPPSFAHYRHYSLSNDGITEGVRNAIWKYDDPFNAIFDDDVCSDPVWCENAAEMQRRIFAWQFPNHNYHSLANDRVEVFRDRTCENSKFLVFEPPSNRQGIGSM